MLWCACEWCCEDYVLQHGSRDEHMSAFLHWLSDHGVDTSAVAIKQFGAAGYGLKAVHDIKVNTLILMCSVLSHSRSEGWPHCGHTFSIYRRLLSS